MLRTSCYTLIVLLGILLTMTALSAEELDGHLYGVAIIPTDAISGFPESTLAALERQTDLRFRPFHYGDFSHGLDLQTWAPDYIKDVEPGREREFTRLLHDKPSFVLKFSSKDEPTWLRDGLAAYVKDGGVLITELPKGTDDSPNRDDALLWARAVEELVYAKCGKPLPTVNVKAPDTLRAGETLKVTLATSSLYAGKATVGLDDQAGVTRMTVTAQLAAEKNTDVLLPTAPDLSGGPYHLWVKVAGISRSWAAPTYQSPSHSR